MGDGPHLPAPREDGEEWFTTGADSHNLQPGPEDFETDSEGQGGSNAVRLSIGAAIN